MEKETSKIALKKLIEEFKNSERQINTYNEEDVKQKLIQPFFKLLGWDFEKVGKDSEVKYEGSLIDPKTKTLKRVDYIFGKKHFFLEAKSTGKDSLTDENILQANGYAYHNSKFCVLTNFKEFKLIKPIRPNKRKPKLALVEEFNFSYEDYLNKFDHIYEVFSKISVFSGSLEKLLEKEKSKRKFLTIDEDFLNDLDQWRKDLALDIYKNNLKAINSNNELLTEYTQRILDRVIFSKMLEDKRIEENILAKYLRKENIYQKMTDDFKELGRAYNGLIFNPHSIDELKVTDKLILEILNKLYDTEKSDSIYQFDLIPIEILGSIYERFLGKIIEIHPENKRDIVRIDEKEEVKKAGGVFYTPDYVVSYVVENTIGKLLEGKTVRQIEDLKIADISCGSGSFLVGAYTYLLNWYEKYYNTNLDKIKDNCLEVTENFKKADGQTIEVKTWKLSRDKRKEILRKHIYGVDIDPQAAEITQMSLYIKMLEDCPDLQKTLSLKEFILPDMKANIKCGNSLVSDDIPTLNPVDKSKIKPFNWKLQFPEIVEFESNMDGTLSIAEGKGFDCIIGNPPYIEIQTLSSIYPRETEYIKKRYITAKDKNIDIYIPFIEKGLELLKQKGVLGYICPNRYLVSDYGEGLKNYLLKFNIYKIVNFRHYFVFKDSDCYTNLIFVQKKAQENVIPYTEIRGLFKTNNVQAQECLLNKTKPLTIDSLIKPEFKKMKYWYFMTEEEFTIFNKIISSGDPFENIYEENFQGLICGKDKIFIMKLLKKKTKTGIYYSEELKEEIEIESSIMRPIISDPDIKRYFVENSGDEHILFPYSNNGDLIPTETMKSKYSLAWEYLSKFRKDLRLREAKNNNSPFDDEGWYRFSRNQNLNKQGFKKILIPHVVKNMRSAFDPEGIYAIKNVGVNGITLREGINEDYFYILAILNHPISSFIISKISIFLSGGFYAANKQFSGKIPIYRIKTAEDKKIQDLIIENVKALIGIIQQNRNDKTSYGKNDFESAVTKRNKIINDLIYKLYKFNPNSNENELEIKIIENELISENLTNYSNN